MRELTPAEKAIHRASDEFGLCDMATGIHFVTGEKIPASLLRTKSRKATADAARRLREKTERTETEHRAYLDHKNALRRANRDHSNALRRARRELKKQPPAARTTCAAGHPISPDTAVSSGARTYSCATCLRDWQDAANENRRAKRAELRAKRAETPEQYRARLSAVAKERGDRQRAERGNTCVNGHPVSNLGGECFECRRARQPRVNEMRRLADAAKRRLADFGLEDAA